MRVVFLAFGLLIFTQYSSAQIRYVFIHPNYADSITYQNDDILIKLDVASVMIETLSLSTEFFLKPSRISLNSDLAYLFSSKYSENSDIGFFGFSFRPQIRYYARPSIKQNERWFVGLSTRYKFGQSSGNQVLGFDCDDANGCDYLSLYSGKAFVHRIDMQLHYGTQIKVYDDFYLEADLGLGYGYEDQKINGVDMSEGRLYDASLHMNHRRIGWGINGSVAFRLVFVIDGSSKTPNDWE